MESYSSTPSAYKKKDDYKYELFFQFIFTFSLLIFFLLSAKRLMLNLVYKVLLFIFRFFIPWWIKFSSLMLCMIGMNEYGRNWMEFELYYGQMFINFISSSIPFHSLHHILEITTPPPPNLRRNASFLPILIFFSNLIITIWYSLNIFQKLSV